MPKVYNTLGHKAGSIYRMKLTNFVTYKLVELYPGTSLNMIIGPNGTGKSTFVCALILGLCGNIHSIGRAKKISEYVRSGHDKAEIEIELYQDHKQPNVVITRVFDREDKSKWYIDKMPSNLKSVKELIAKYGIQVDNLCQLLPQDRVTDFARMDAPTLLENTLSALGLQERVQQLHKLKTWRADQLGLTERLKKNEKTKQALITQNEMLKVRIDALNQRKVIDEELKACECKKLWLAEAALRHQCRRYDEEKREADKTVKTQQAKVRPLEASMESVKRQIEELEKEKLDVHNQIDKLRGQVDEFLRTVKVQNDKIKEAHTRYVEVEKQRESDLKELNQKRLNLNKLQMDEADAARKYGDETKMRMELANVEAPMEKLKTERNTLKRQRDEIQHNLETRLFPEISRCKSMLHERESEERKRLELLERVSGDAFKALQWLQHNRGLFSGAVCSPMMLEINFPERKYAKYLEGTVAQRDLVAFTFADKDDMNLFLRKVRQELGLKRVNAVCSPPGRGNIQTPDISNIRHLGFQKYIVETFEAPDMIVRFLCRNYNVHRIPVGDDYTYQHSEHVPTNITLFFSENHRFSVKVSAYSGYRSTSISEVRAPHLLAVAVDPAHVQKWTDQLTQVEAKRKQREAKKMSIEASLAKLEEEYSEYTKKKQDLINHSGQIMRIRNKIRDVKNDMVYLERKTAELDLSEERRLCAVEQEKCAAKQVKNHRELTAIVAQIHELAASKELATLKLNKTRSSISDKETALRELKRSLHQAEETLNNILQLKQRAKEKADAKLIEAKRSSNNKSPRDAQFPFKEIYEKLPSELDKLEEYRGDLMTKINCMSDIDEGDLRTFEENKKKIEELSLEEKSAKTEHKKLVYSMSTMKEDWVRCIRRQLESINGSFSEMFAKLGCGGEVRLKHGASQEDFASYGVQVMVQFRAGEALSELTAHTQSGGERALSTAIYLLALQRLSTVPFRCVDEINQGMDSQNERKMFEFLVKVTTEGDQGQYFLLTPKLLTDLQYNANITVHTIMNGCGAMPYDQWRLDEFERRAREAPSRSAK